MSERVRLCQKWLSHVEVVHIFSSDTTTNFARSGYATLSAHLAMRPQASYAWPLHTHTTLPTPFHPTYLTFHAAYALVLVGPTAQLPEHAHVKVGSAWHSHLPHGCAWENEKGIERGSGPDG